MKNILTLAFYLAFSLVAAAQSKIPPTDKSPLDVSYFPDNYPVLKIQDKVTEPLIARVIYSRPQKNERKVFGELIEYGKLWRLGANEATEIEFYVPVKINDTKIKKGRYTLYAIPNSDEWTIILNKENDTWGSFKYDQKKDVVRTTVAVQKTDIPIESLAMAFEKIATGCNLIIAWENIKVALPVTF